MTKVMLRGLLGALLLALAATLPAGAAEPKAWDEGRTLEDTYERFMRNT